MGMDYAAAMEAIREQERELEFGSFDSFDALRIGQKIIERAVEEKKTIAVHISLNHRDLFHFSFPDCAPENDHWVRRKENTAYFFGRSSLSVEYEMLMKDRDMLSYFGLKEPMCAKGGAFPIRLKGTGMVGVIVVSGMLSHQDHAFAAEAAKEYLAELAKA